MDIGYARVSTAKQDLDRQIDALRKEGVADKYIYVDKKSGSTTNRPGLHKALDQAREGDIIVVHTLDRSDAPQAVAACTPQRGMSFSEDVCTVRMGWPGL